MIIFVAVILHARKPKQPPGQPMDGAGNQLLKSKNFVLSYQVQVIVRLRI